MWRWRPWLVSFTVTGGLFWYLLSQIDISELVRTAWSMTPRHLWMFVTLLLAGVILRALRFWILLNRTVPIHFLTAIVMARNLFVDLLPARLGELSYVYLITKRAGRPTEDALASLFLAVLFDVVALTPLLFLAALIVGGIADFSLPLLVTVTISLAAVACIVMWAAAPIGTWLANWIGLGHPVAWRAQLAQLAERTANALREAYSRHIIVPVLLLSMVIRLCKFGGYCFLVLAIMAPLGYTVGETGIFRIFLGVVGAELAAALPIHGIAGFGTFEAAWALSFSQLGFSTEHAILSGILAHAVSQLVEYSLGSGALLYVMRPTSDQTT
jgi:uncharacterized membrane protein YbhN (UPF0104 family)